MSKKTRIQELAKEILKHKKLYYSGQKEIEDEEYDALEMELTSLDPENPVLSVVGSEFFEGEKVKHETKMLSLDKTYIEKDLEKWMGNHILIGTYKIDGNSSSLIYENGKLTLAKTRGDGEYGEKITNQVMFIPSVPKNIKYKNQAEIRGEIYCTHEKFELLVEEMVKRGIDRPKSERNIVAGILGRKDHRDLAEYLDFFAFDYLTEEELETEEDKCKKIQEHDFVLPPMKKISSKKELNAFVKQTESFMNEGDYLIDGAVLSYNSLDEQEKAGFTGHHPKFKIAFKFMGEVKETKLVDVHWHISRFGVLTPVGEIEPVELSGATITNVTLHNLNAIKTFNLKKGDTVKIIRSGEVIPKFLSVVKSSNNKLEIPKNCHCCQTELIQEEVRLICPNEECVGRHEEYILNFIQKIGIDDLSEKRLEVMITKGLVTDIPSLYRLTEEQLLTLPSTKEKLAKKIIKNIESSKKVNIIKFLSSLSFVGGARKNTELVLDNGVSNFEELFNLNVEALLKIKGFAKKKATDYVESIQRNRDLINELLELGFEVEFPEKAGDTLKGITFCITGEVHVASNRKELEKLIKSLGGSASSSVSSKTNYLICNEESSSSKYKKAQDLGIPILTEEQFQEEFGVEI